MRIEAVHACYFFRVAVSSRVLRCARCSAACRRRRIGAGDRFRTNRASPTSPRDRKSPSGEWYCCCSSPVTSNSSQARPGSFISAHSRSRCGGRRLRLARSPAHHPRAGSPDRAGRDGHRRRRTADPENRGATTTSCRSTSRSDRRCGESVQTPAPAEHRRSPSRIDQPRTEAHAAPGPWRSAGRQRIGPARFRELAIFVHQGPGDRFADRARPNGKCLGGQIVRDERRVAEAFDQFPADPGIQRRDQTEPQARKIGRQQRHGNHPPPESPLSRIFLHDLPVGNLIRTADLIDSGRDRRANLAPRAGRTADPRWRSAAPSLAPNAGRS